MTTSRAFLTGTKQPQLLYFHIKYWNLIGLNAVDISFITLSVIATYVATGNTI